MTKDQSAAELAHEAKIFERNLEPFLDNLDQALGGEKSKKNFRKLGKAMRENDKLAHKRAKKRVK
jgi:hypothetical protein